MAVSSSGPEQAPRFSSPQEETLLNIIRTADHLHRAFQLRLKPSGLTPTQYNVLRILRSARPEGLTCAAIGRSMITREPDITRLLNRLKAQKFLIQERDTHDRRVVWTHITRAGLDVLAGLDDVVDRAPRELLNRLSGDELKELSRLLKKARSVDESCPEAEQASQSGKPAFTGKPSLPRLRQSTPLRHPPE